MNIDDAVQALADDIIDNIVDTIHPGFIHITIYVHVVIPRYRDTDGSETCVLHHRQELSLGGELTPA